MHLMEIRLSKGHGKLSLHNKKILPTTLKYFVCTNLQGIYIPSSEHGITRSKKASLSMLHPFYVIILDTYSRKRYRDNSSTDTLNFLACLIKT